MCLLDESGYLVVPSLLPLALKMNSSRDAALLPCGYHRSGNQVVNAIFQDETKCHTQYMAATKNSYPTASCTLLSIAFCFLITLLFLVFGCMKSDKCIHSMGCLPGQNDSGQ